MNKRIIIIITAFLIIIGLICIFSVILLTKNIVQQETSKDKVEIKTTKDVIYRLFNNFPESENIYYISKNLYNERTIGPTIYQIDILAELTDDGYNSFIKQLEFQNLQEFEMKFNPNNINYNWKDIKNIQIIETKDAEETSITKIYLDETKKTIYIVAIGGN